MLRLRLQVWMGAMESTRNWAVEFLRDPWSWRCSMRHLERKVDLIQSSL